jgi:hypothetical protein
MGLYTIHQASTPDYFVSIKIGRWCWVTRRTHSRVPNAKRTSPLRVCRVIPSTGSFFIVLNPVYAPTVSSPRVTVKLYSVGEAGDHSLGLSSLNWKADPADPVPVAMVFPDSSYSLTETDSDDSSDEWTVMFTAGQLSPWGKRKTYLDHTYQPQCPEKRYEPWGLAPAIQSAIYRYRGYRRYGKGRWFAFRLQISYIRFWD